MAENGKIRFPESGNPSLPPPAGSFYVWLSTDGFFKKMDSLGNVTNLSAQSISDMTDVDLTGLQDGQVLVWNQATGTWIPADMSGGGVGTFVELTDTPSQYTGMAGKVVSVNEAENALEFSDKAAGASITNARYKYQTSTSDTNGAGAVRFNNSNPSLATQIFFNRVDLDGHDLNEFFATFIDETYSVFLQNEEDKNSAIKVKILGSGTLGGGTLGGQLQTWIFPCEYNRGTSTALTNDTECSTVFLHTTPVDYPVESVNGKTGVVVLDPDDLDDSSTDHKFASQTQLDQISTNAGDIALIETDLGNLETQVNTNTGNIATNTGNISTNTSNIATNASDISDLQDQIDGGVGKTYTGVEAIEVNNTDDQISLKLTEDNSGQFDSMTVSGFNSDFNHNFEVVKRDGERVNIDLDLEGQNIILNYDSGTHQLYRCLTHDDMFIGYCDEIGYWIAVKLTVSHNFDVELNGSATLGLQSWLQLGTLSTLLGNGNYVPTSSYLSYTGFAINNSYLSQSASGLTANVSSDLSAAQAYELADALDVKQSLDAKITDPDTSLQVNRPYFLERTEFNNGIIVDTWVQTDTLGGGGEDPRWTADPVAIGQDAGLTNQAAQSIAIGTEAGSDTQGTLCVAIGNQAGRTAQGDGSVALGNLAGFTNQALGCFALGQNAGYSDQSNYAAAIGADAGKISQGVQAVAVGNASGNEYQGSYSVAVGYKAGDKNQGTNAVAIGSRACNSSQPNSSICINGSSSFLNITGSKVIKIGLSDYDVYIGDGNVSSVSDRRDKYDIQDIPLGLDFVNALEPKFFKYDIRELYEEVDDTGVVTKNTPNRSMAGSRFHSGFIAQDVKATMDSFGVDFGVYRDQEIKAEEVHKELARDKLSLCYQEFIAIQTKAIQELSSKVSLLESEIETLKGQ